MSETTDIRPDSTQVVCRVVDLEQPIGADERRTLLAVEPADDDRVQLVLGPGADDTQVIEVGVRAAWKLSRLLARAAAFCEFEDARGES